MIIESNKIISRSEFINNTKETLNELKERGEFYIFDENKPKYVIMSINKYEEICKSNTSQEIRNTTNSENKDVVEILNAIGKKVFVDYYYDFKNDDSPEDKLPDEYTLNSKRSRSSKARKLFRENQNINALEIIIKSDRIDDETINNAKIIMAKELNGDTDLIEEMYLGEEKIKIGKLARTTIIKLITEKKLTIDEIKEMTFPEHSKKIFNLNYPVLKLVDGTISLEEQRKDKNGYNRYYGPTVNYYGKTYLICSQWVEDLHRVKLDKWILSKQLID